VRAKVLVLGQDRDLWRHLWKLKDPACGEGVLWRACSNALATKANLFRRKITEDPLCPMCAESSGNYWSYIVGLPSG
jgi:hypothetical protein